jgi:hypothetical protein
MKSIVTDSVPRPNRIETAIRRTEDMIKEKLKNGLVTQEKLKELHKAIDMPLDEYCQFQTTKSAAMGTNISLEEAQTIYHYLGESPDTFNNQPLAIKVVLTQVWKEMLEARIKRSRTR